ncbi:hypothetical protein [Nostoc sp.]|uniref:hypothetical protein n=1 Tax=Nostoc sp. TaxID=1180 RepID=UPI002FFB76CC
MKYQLGTYGESVIEEEFRSQNSGAQPERFPLAPVRINQSGIQTRDFLVDHQIENLVGVLNPFIYSSAFSVRKHC